MSSYDSAYLLSLFNRLTGRPVADAVTPASKYDRLSEAQDAIVADIAAVCPYVLYPTVAYGNIPTLTTTDNQNFTFLFDENGDPITPMGDTTIYASLTDIPTNPWRAGRDYIPLGATTIQIPNNRTYSGTLYWRGITPPAAISASSEPALFPLASRRLIAVRAAIAFLTEAGRNPGLAAQYMLEYGRPFGGQPGSFAAWCLEWRTAYRGGGVLGNRVSGLQVAIGSYTNNAG